MAIPRRTCKPLTRENLHELSLGDHYRALERKIKDGKIHGGARAGFLNRCRDLERELEKAREALAQIYAPREKTTKTIISLDFDGVICRYPGWTGPRPIGEPVEGAWETVWWLLEQGYEVFIMSARVRDPLGKAGIEQWLREQGFPPLEVTVVKRHADLYVDDRGFRFEGPQSWNALRDFLRTNPDPSRWEKVGWGEPHSQHKSGV
jgi:hypothetical protein